jgi:hypothetical protein
VGSCLYYTLIGQRFIKRHALFLVDDIVVKGMKKLRLHLNEIVAAYETVLRKEATKHPQAQRLCAAKHQIL